MKYILMFLLLLTACNETRLKEIPDCIPYDEVCNGKDDDCDGIADNPDKLEIKPCYTADPAKLAYGICRFGVERCIGGKLQCLGQILPKEEACNALDDDCDGAVDEGYDAKADLIFVIDYSGSMTDKLEKLINIVSQWGIKYGMRNDIKIALIGAPSYVDAYDGKIHVISRLTDINNFITAISYRKTAGANGSEPSLDAIYLLSDPTNPLLINWSQNATRAIFLFTDEEPQSYLFPKLLEADVKDMAIRNNMKVYIFSSNNYWYSWDPYPLDTTVALLSSYIDDAIGKSICK